MNNNNSQSSALFSKGKQQHIATNKTGKKLLDTIGVTNKQTTNSLLTPSSSPQQPSPSTSDVLALANSAENWETVVNKARKRGRPPKASAILRPHQPSDSQPMDTQDSRDVAAQHDPQSKRKKEGSSREGSGASSSSSVDKSPRKRRYPQRRSTAAAAASEAAAAGLPATTTPKATRTASADQQFDDLSVLTSGSTDGMDMVESCFEPAAAEQPAAATTTTTSSGAAEEMDTVTSTTSSRRQPPASAVAYLNFLGKVVQVRSGCGDCLYEAIFHSCVGHRIDVGHTSWEQLREGLLGNMSLHADKFSKYFDNNGPDMFADGLRPAKDGTFKAGGNGQFQGADISVVPFRQHLERARRPQEYGTQIEITCFATQHDLNIWVVQDGLAILVKGCSNFSLQRPEEREIWIHFNGTNHYSAVVPAPSGEDTVLRNDPAAREAGRLMYLNRDFYQARSHQPTTTVGGSMDNVDNAAGKEENHHMITDEARDSHLGTEQTTAVIIEETFHQFMGEKTTPSDEREVDEGAEEEDRDMFDIDNAAARKQQQQQHQLRSTPEEEEEESSPTATAADLGAAFEVESPPPQHRQPLPAVHNQPLPDLSHMISHNWRFPIVHVSHSSLETKSGDLLSGWSAVWSFLPTNHSIPRDNTDLIEQKDVTSCTEFQKGRTVLPPIAPNSDKIFSTETTKQLAVLNALESTFAKALQHFNSDQGGGRDSPDAKSQRVLTIVLENEKILKLIKKECRAPADVHANVLRVQAAWKHVQQATSLDNVHFIVLKSAKNYEPAMFASALAMESRHMLASIPYSAKFAPSQKAKLREKWDKLQAKSSKTPNAESVKVDMSFFVPLYCLCTSSQVKKPAKNYSMSMRITDVGSDFVCFRFAEMNSLKDFFFRVDYNWLHTHATTYTTGKQTLLTASGLEHQTVLQKTIRSALFASTFNGSISGMDESNTPVRQPVRDLISRSASTRKSTSSAAAAAAAAGGNNPATSPPSTTAAAPSRSSTSTEDDENDSDSDDENDDEASGVGLNPPSMLDIPLPDLAHLQPCWQAVKDFDLGLLGEYQLSTIEKPLYYLRKNYARFLKQVLRMVVDTSSVHLSADKFQQETHDLTLKLVAVLPLMIFQNDKESAMKRRATSFAKLEWDAIFKAATQQLLDNSIKRSVPLVEEVDELGDITPFLTFEKLGKKAEKHIKNGEIRKAKQALTDPATFAPPTGESFAKLQSKHPKREVRNNMEEEVRVAAADFVLREEDKITVTDEMVWKVITNASRGASPGVDGLRFDQLYYISEGGSADWLKPFAALIRLALGGHLPQWFMSFLASANLIALAKGETDIRPVAMGSVWRKIFGTCGLLHYLDDIIKHFQLYQYGVGSKAGCEVVIHRVEELLRQNARFVVAKSDFKNAFNSLFRKRILAALRNSFPGLYKYVVQVYGTGSDLWAFIEQGRRQAMSSEEGVQQGDVLGPFLFCLVVHPILLELNEHLRTRGGGEVLGLMDDFSAVCLPEDLPSLWQILEQRASDVGLNLSIHKCEVYSPGGFSDEIVHHIPEGIQHRAAGITLLGGVVGSNEFCEQHWMSYISDVEREADIVCTWDNVQAGLCLFRFCVASRLVFMLRSVSPFMPYTERVVNAASRVMKKGLSSLLGGAELESLQQDDSWWLQATLPPKMGGLGIIDPSAVQPLAYLASEAAVSASLTLLNAPRNLPPAAPSDTARTIYEQHIGVLNLQDRPPLTELFAEPTHLQHKLCMDVHKGRSNKLRTKGTQMIHHLDSCCAEAGILVTAIPKCQFTTIRNKEEMRERLCLRLNLDVNFLVSGPCHCKSCKSTSTRSDGFVDTKGYHTRSVCKKGGSRISNHNSVRDQLQEFFRAAGLTCRTEDGQVMRAAGRLKSKSKVDVAADNFDGVRQLGVDVSVVDVRSAAYSKLVSPVGPGKAATDREVSKIKKYRPSYQSQNAIFEPFVLETQGRFGPVTRDLFNTISERIHARSDFTLAMVKNYWRQRIVMALHIKSSANVRKAWDEVLRRRQGLASKAVSAWSSTRVVDDMATFDRRRY